MHLPRFLLIGFFSLLSVGGCSSDSDPESKADTWWEQYAQQSCANAAPCCQAAGLSHSVSSCAALVKLFGASTNGKFDAAAGEQCLTELRAQTGQCDAREPAACGRVVTGSVAKGGKCEDNFACAAPAQGEATCTLVAGGDSVCVHEIPAGEGLPCGPADDTTRYLCDDDPNLYCDGQTCTKRLVLGAECTSGSCASDGYCDTTASPAKCVAKGTTGKSCAAFMPCADTDYCDNGVCQAKKKTGEACTAFAECDGFCESDGKCAANTGISVCVE